MEEIEVALLCLVAVFITWVILPWTFWLLVVGCAIALILYLGALTIRDQVRMVIPRPRTFQDCVRIARRARENHTQPRPREE